MNSTDDVHSKVRLDQLTLLDRSFNPGERVSKYRKVRLIVRYALTFFSALIITAFFHFICISYVFLFSLYVFRFFSSLCPFHIRFLLLLIRPSFFLPSIFRVVLRFKDTWLKSTWNATCGFCPLWLPVPRSFLRKFPTLSLSPWVLFQIRIKSCLTWKRKAKDSA